MLKQLIIIFSLLLVTIITPMVLRPAETRKIPADAEVLVVITTHDPAVRRTFEEAFAEHMNNQGREVRIDWRLPNRSVDVARQLDASYKAADQRGREGIGIDLLFGGRAHDFNRHASNGHLAPSRVFIDHPEWFQPEIIPFSFTGEQYFHPAGLWVGACLTSYGIVYNTDSLARLGIDTPPNRWEDLADPRYFGQIALADPTQSSAANKAFEMLIQEQIHARLEAIPSDAIDPQRARSEAISRGWEQGLQLIQKISANARHFTGNPAKIPLDVAQDNAAAGMSVDFHGRTFDDLHRQSNGESRIQFVIPENGSSISADPIAILRGASNRDLAESFVAFVLSVEGQRLWNYRAGTPGGPQHTSLRRLPIRKDLYVGDELRYFADPDALPYQHAGNFVYRPELTGQAFDALALIIRSMCLDSHREQRRAWQTLQKTGFPPAARRAFFDVSEAGYGRSIRGINQTLDSENPLDAMRLSRRLTNNFRKNYLLAADLAGTHD